MANLVADEDNGFNKVKQQTEDTSEGNMKHLKLGKIQWIALLVVSAMFVNLCSHMVLAAARDGNDPAQGTTAEATTASEATTESNNSFRSDNRNYNGTAGRDTVYGRI